MSPPLISVVIPSYNHRDFIGAAIDSVLRQSHQRIELIVVDDGSTDDTAELLGTIRDDRMRMVLAHTNRGAHATLNEGIALAKGEYVSILNSDDVYAPDRLQILLDAVRKNNSALAFSSLSFIGAKGQPLEETRKGKGYRRALERSASIPVEEGLVRGNFTITSSNIFFHRELLERIGGFRGYRYCHDWDFLLRSIGRCRITWVREPLLGYRMHARNTIREHDPWRLSAEHALVYATLFLDRAGRSLSFHSDFFFDAKPFEPMVVAWTMAEIAQNGFERTLAEMEAGELHRRLQAAFESRGIGPDARLSAQRILKYASRPWRRLLAKAARLIPSKRHDTRF